IECVHEVKQVADILYARGPAGMRAAISNAAEYGAFEGSATLVDDHVRHRMRELLQRIRSGAFAQTMTQDTARGSPWLNEQRRHATAHPMESVGRDVRALMPWLTDGERAT